MLTQIVVDSENAFTVPILGVTPKESVLVRTITGLNPPDITLFIGDYSRDGGIYQGRRVGNRNVVLTFDLNPNPALGETIQGWRDILYKAFVDPQIDSDYIKIDLHDDNGRVRYVVGYTEKFETEIFDVDTMCQISIICPDPYIRSSEVTYLDGPGTGWVTVPFTYDGTAETGFETEIVVTAPTPILSLENNGRVMKINKSFVAGSTGDVVYINTIRGQREILSAKANDIASFAGLSDYGLHEKWEFLKAHHVTTPLIGYLSSDSPWLELHSQSNSLTTYGTASGNTIAAISHVQYTSAYWGI